MIVGYKAINKLLRFNGLKLDHWWLWMSYVKVTTTLMNAACYLYYIATEVWLKVMSKSMS